MSHMPDGGPAFSCMPPQDTAAGVAVGYPYPDQGMTMRDYFAAKAMQSILQALVQGIRPQDCIKAAEDAYYIADAMLKARGS